MEKSQSPIVAFLGIKGRWKNEIDETQSFIRKSIDYFF